MKTGNIAVFVAGTALAIFAGFMDDALAANRPPVGGGSTRAGFDGEYFANPRFEGEPAFTRRDVRIHFDWKEGIAGRGLPVGGATTPGMADFPLDDFSIRWTGAVVARFSEVYTFRITGHDGVRFTLDGKVLVDSLERGAVHEVEAALEEGDAVDLVFEYVDRAGTGASVARLEWSSPSTPREVVEPLSFAQADLHLASPGIWLALEMADMVRMANRRGWQGADNQSLTLEQVDADGWPTVSTARLPLSVYGSRTYEGVYQIAFTGQAAVRVEGGMAGTWSTGPGGAGDTFEGTLSRRAGYSAETNTTTVWFNATRPGHMSLRFDEAERTPREPGIADLRVHYPVARGADEHHLPGEIYTREARAFFRDFVVLRKHIGSSLNPGETWEERTLPSYFHREHVHHNWGYNLEELIMAANDVGKDLHLCAGASWNEDFMRKLAQLVRYGSDGVNPYDRYVENPKYPPLNPNLRIYIEHSNELPWAVYPRRIWDDLRKKVEENHPDWWIVNYDGQCNGADGRAMFRYHALRMRQLSDAFRAVYADMPGANGDRFRVLCFGQYEQPHQNTMLQFLDAYFNKTDPASTWDGEPEPPRAYIWGGGGAIYYGTSNRFGLMTAEAVYGTQVRRTGEVAMIGLVDEPPIANGGFELPVLPEGAAVVRPEGSGWTFEGHAGIASTRLPNGRPAVTFDELPDAPVAAPPGELWAGMRFTVGDRDLYVSRLGRWLAEAPVDRRQPLDLAILDTGGRRVAEFRTTAPLHSFEPGKFAYEWCAVRAFGGNATLPARLLAGETYYLVSRERSGANAARYFGPVPVTAAEGIRIEAAVTGRDGRNWEEIPGSLSYGPVDMIFTSGVLQSEEGVVGIAPDLSESVFRTPWGLVREQPFDFGAQTAFLSGGSRMAREFTVEKEGAYWIVFNVGLDPVTGGRPGTIRVLVNGEDQASPPLPRGGHMSRPEPMHYAATRVFRLEPGTHTVTFQIDNPRAGTAFIDEVHLGSEEAFYGGREAPNFPAGGRAIGQNPSTGYHRTAQGEVEMSRNWGLVPMTYEGGWAVQADFDHYSMQAWNDLRYGSPATNPDLTRRALRNAFDIWCETGGYIYAFYYQVTPEVSDTDAPLLNEIRAMNDRLPVPARNGPVLPATLTAETRHVQGGISTAYSPSWSDRMKSEALPAHSWKSWLVTAPARNLYRIRVTGTGGPLTLLVNDRAVATGDPAEGFGAAVELVPGLHAVKVRTGAEAAAIRTITLEVQP